MTKQAAAQTAYTIAKTQYDMINAQVSAFCATLDYGETDEQLEAATLVEEGYRTQIGYYEAFQVLRNAEAALLAWGRIEALRIATINEAANVEMVFSSKNFQVRTKAIALCMRLAV